jgi:hypothetical protein
VHSDKDVHDVFHASVKYCNGYQEKQRNNWVQTTMKPDRSKEKKKMKMTLDIKTKPKRLPRGSNQRRSGNGAERSSPDAP